MGVKTLVEIDMEGARKALAVAGYINDWNQGSDDEIKNILFKALRCYGIKDVDTKVYDEDSVLDKIRAEIEQDVFKDVNGSKYIFVNRVNQIIDKYKADFKPQESEKTDADSN